MKKNLFSLMLILAVCCGLSAAPAKPENFNINTRDLAVIKTYEDWMSANAATAKPHQYPGYVILNLRAVSALDGNVSYETLKNTITAANPTIKCYTLLYFLINVDRFKNIPALTQAFANDKEWTNINSYKARRIFLRGLTQTQYIAAFRDGMKTAKTPEAALKVLNQFIKVSNKYSTTAILPVVKSVKRALYAKITDDAWKPVLVKLELFMQSMQ